MELTYYKMIFSDPEKISKSRIFWDKEYLAEQIIVHEEKGDSFIVLEYTEKEVYRHVGKK